MYIPCFLLSNKGTYFKFSFFNSHLNNNVQSPDTFLYNTNFTDCPRATFDKGTGRVCEPIAYPRNQRSCKRFFSNKNVQSSEIIFEQTVISNLLSLDGVETAIREEYNTLRYEFTLWKIRDKRQIFDIPAALGES